MHIITIYSKDFSIYLILKKLLIKFYLKIIKKTIKHKIALV